MSRALQDQFIDDDEEETCPLCVEEFDLTDKGFRPCPCGYQICQFCYHNVKNNMNGLCPACRRIYDEKNIEYKVITPEETAAHRARLAQRQKKTQAMLQKEKQKAEADHLSRKHLAGLRVVQKNLVYVTGLSPTSQEDQLLQTLRGEQYFGQYGKIIKIVVSKPPRDPTHPHSVGVYVTYEHKEDAQACITAVNGSKNGERTLRAQFGTTKYCSAYLRNETCTNRNCMFLHEPGEANESYSRADLSALNAGSTQHGETRPPPPQSQQPVASAAPPMARQASSDQAGSPTTDRPALPSTASWASKPAQVQPSRTGSRSTSGNVDSPAPVNAIPATPAPEPQETKAPEPIVETSLQQPLRKLYAASPFLRLLKNFSIDDFKLALSISSLAESDIEVVKNFPPLFDQDGGAKRRIRRQREEEQRRMEQEAQAFQQPPDVESEDTGDMSGSLQLGGDPDDRQGSQRAIQSLGQDGVLDQRFQFGGVSSPASSDRVLTPQQQHQLLQTMKGTGDQGSFQGAPGHQRNVSRYSFANDTSASTAVKPVANQKLMNQQSSIMPQAGSNQFGNNQQFYTSNVQGPPPGLKTTGTPPVSGGMTFGQGHGFATGGMQYGANATGRNANEEMMRNLLRGRPDGSVEGASKRDLDFPPLGPPSRQASISLEESRLSTPPIPPGFEAQMANESRRSTPIVPPGLSKPSALPNLDDEGSISRPTSRPSSRASLRRQASQILPALPLRPGTPGRSATPNTGTKQDDKDETRRDMVHETPTKAPRGLAKDREGKDLGEETVSVVDQSSKDAEPKPADKLSATSSKTPIAKDQPTVSSTDERAIPVTPSKIESKKDDKKKRPGKIDLATPVTKPEPAPVWGGMGLVDTETPAKAQRTATQSPATVSKAPESPSNIASPAVRPAPRTLRVVQTPKSETPPPQAPGLAKLPSRQPSLASMNLPGTPSSEQVSMSDNISMTSTSLSRANSPPPSKVGSAPVRTKTKSQMKKDRHERAKALEEEKVKEDNAGKEDSEPAQEAIVGRKKKSKKEKEPKAKPAGPVEAKPVPKPAPVEPKPAPVEPPKPEPLIVIPDNRIEEPFKALPTPPQPAPPMQAQSLQSPHEPSPPATPTISTATLLAELKSSPDFQKSIESLFRTPTSAHFKPGQSIQPKDLQNNYKPDQKINLTKEEVEALLHETIPAIQYGGEDGRVWDRGMITPSGAHLRALTDELENRFLELEKALRDMPEELHFHPSKPQNELKFSHMDLEALKRQYDNVGGRGVSAMEQMVQDGATMKKGAFLVDEASKYINEFVMPPATPPPSIGGGSSRGGQTAGNGNGGAQEGSQVGLEMAERQLHEARRVADEKENALRKIIKKNKKLLGIA